jgi:hypothetical protein
VLLGVQETKGEWAEEIFVKRGQNGENTWEMEMCIMGNGVCMHVDIEAWSDELNKSIKIYRYTCCLSIANREDDMMIREASKGLQRPCYDFIHNTASNILQQNH